LEALEAAKRVGVSTTKASRIVRNYYQDFRLKRKFQVRVLGRDNLPPFLEQNKDICTAMQQYAREHLSELSVELMCEYLDEMVLPKMVKERTGIEKGEFVSEEYEVEVDKF
jgi:glutamate racemase